MKIGGTIGTYDTNCLDVGKLKRFRDGTIALTDAVTHGDSITMGFLWNFAAVLHANKHPITGNFMKY